MSCGLDENGDCKERPWGVVFCLNKYGGSGDEHDISGAGGDYPRIRTVVHVWRQPLGRKLSENVVRMVHKTFDMI